MASFKAYVINLARDTQRRAHMETQLEKIGLHAEFIPAVDGRSLSSADRAACDAAKTLRVYGVPMLDAEIGCYLSHYRLYQHMIRDGDAYALIMEDDIEISPALPRIVSELIADPSPEWLVVRLESLRAAVREGRKAKFMGRCVAPLSDGGVYKLKTHVLGFGAYLISRNGAERMLEYGKRIFMPVDQTMDRFWDNGIVPYIVRPLPVHQRQDFDSCIGTRLPGRHKGQPLALQLQRRWQRLSDGIRKRVVTLFS